MKKLILDWLFGTDNIDEYMTLLGRYSNDLMHQIKIINDHLETLDRLKEEINLTQKLIRVCENHGIDVDKEIKQIEL